VAFIICAIREGLHLYAADDDDWCYGIESKTTRSVFKPRLLCTGLDTRVSYYVKLSLAYDSD